MTWNQRDQKCPVLAYQKQPSLTKKKNTAWLSRAFVAFLRQEEEDHCKSHMFYEKDC